MIDRHALAFCVLLMVACPCVTMAAIDPGVGVHFDQQLGLRLPGNAVLHDEQGRERTLSELIHSTPTVLIFGYAGCSQLCPTLLHSTALALAETGLSGGRDWRGLFVSIDPAEQTRRLAAMKSTQIPMSQQAAWHFVSGADGTSTRLAADAGFVAHQDAASGQFAHATGLVLLSPRGRIVRYFFGVGFNPDLLRLTLRVAANDEPQPEAEPLLLICIHLLTSGSPHTATVVNLLRLFCVVFIAAGGLALWRWRHTVGAGHPQ